MQHGAQEVLEREYGSYVVQTEPGFDFSVMVDLESIPESKGTLLLFELMRLS